MGGWSQVETSCDNKSDHWLSADILAHDPHHQVEVVAVGDRDTNTVPHPPHGDILLIPYTNHLCTTYEGPTALQFHPNILTLSSAGHGSYTNLTNYISIFWNIHGSVVGIDGGALVSYQVENPVRFPVYLKT